MVFRLVLLGCFKWCISIALQLGPGNQDNGVVVQPLLLTRFDASVMNSSARSAAAAEFAVRQFAQELEALEAENRWPHSKGTTHHQPPARAKYIDEKLELDTSVLNVISKPPVEKSPVAPDDYKIAFLFLLMKETMFPKVWDAFFSSAPTSTYSIYTHSAAMPAGWASDAPPFAKLGGIAIPWVNSSWCALLGVEVALLRAALDDPANKQFVFISHDAVPLKTYDYLHRSLIVSSPHKSKVCFASRARHTHALAEVVSNEVHRRCCYRDFYRAHDARILKHHQWIVLTRTHANVVVRRAKAGLDEWAKTWSVAAPDLPTMGEGCSDESVPVTSLLYDMVVTGHNSSDPWADLETLGVERQCLTYVHWYHCLEDTRFKTPRTHSIFRSIVERGGDLWNMMFDKDFDFMKQTTLNAFPTVYSTMSWHYLSSLAQDGFMFVRKISPDISLTAPTDLVRSFASNSTVAAEAISFEAALSNLWDSVDKDLAFRSVWSALDSSGEPERVPMD